jgi:hypothetical protein
LRGILDPGLVSLVAELRGHERQAAEDWTSERPASRSNARRLEAIRILRLVAEELAQYQADALRLVKLAYPYLSRRGNALT